MQQTLNHTAVIRVEILILSPNNPFSFQKFDSQDPECERIGEGEDLRAQDILKSS